MTDVRPATSADLPGAAAIYDEQVRVGISTFDLEPPPLSFWQPLLAGTEPDDDFLVAEDEDERKVVGFAYSSAYRWLDTAWYQLVL